MTLMRVNRGARSVIETALFLCLVGCALTTGAAPASASKENNRYEFRSHHDPDGTGKFYCGREIALVMGHEAADWLERPERNREENTDLLLQKLGLRPGDVVADIGAGTGYLSRRLARKVGVTGRVISEDIQPEMLSLLLTNAAKVGLTNISTVLGTRTDPKLPASSLDLAIMVDVYHEFDYPFEMVQGICKALKPGGRLVFVEYRAEDPNVPIKELHKMTEIQVKKEMAVQPLRWIQTVEGLPWQHVIIFGKGTITDGH